MESLRNTIHSATTKVLICPRVFLLLARRRASQTEEDERSLIRAEYSSLHSLNYTSHLSKEEVTLKSNGGGGVNKSLSGNAQS